MTLHTALGTNSSSAMPGDRRRLITFAAVLGGVGGVLMFADLSLQLLRPLERSYFAIATFMAICMPGVPAAFWLRGAVRPGWRRGLAIIGALIVLLGASAWAVAFVMLFHIPGAAFT